MTEASLLRPHKSPLDVYNFEGSTPKKEDEGESSDCLSFEANPSGSKSSVGLQDAVVRASCVLKRYNPSRCTSSDDLAPSRTSSDDLAGLDEFPIDEMSGSESEASTAVSDTKPDKFEKPCSFHRLQMRPDGVTIVPQRLLPNLSLLGPSSSELYVIRSGGSLAMAMSPGYGGRFDHGGSSTCSSCISSPIILQNESKCFTYSIRRYVESTSIARPESPVDVEEDLNLAYHTLLPLEVHGSSYCSMKLITSQCYLPLT